MGTQVLPLLVWGCIATQAGWLAWAILRFVRRNDEIPLVMAGFLFYCGSYRLLSFYFGFREWSGLEYGLAFSVDSASAGIALILITFGQSVLLASYRFWQNKVLVVQEQRLPGIVISRLRHLLLILTIVGIPVALWLGFYAIRLVAKGMSAAFQISAYAQLFPFMEVALAVFVFLAWRFGVLRNSSEKIGGVVLLLIIGYLTFSPSGRFRFLGWILGGTYVVSTRWFGLKRIPVLLLGALFALTLFGVAGAMRNSNEIGNIDAGIKRTTSAEDANMLDGLVYLMRVYPKMLPYRYGGEHFEILARPIPRAWWPGKPVGGYMNKLGLFNAESRGTTGISPTLFGSFYTEGGWIAVFIFSVIYGWGTARIVRWSSELRPLFGVLIRSGLIAGLIPLLRGGDLPGIYSWLGMAYWPLLFFLWWNRAYLRPLRRSHIPSLRATPHVQRPRSLVPKLSRFRASLPFGRRRNSILAVAMKAAARKATFPYASGTGRNHL